MRERVRADQTKYENDGGWILSVDERMGEIKLMHWSDKMINVSIILQLVASAEMYDDY